MPGRRCVTEKARGVKGLRRDGWYQYPRGELGRPIPLRLAAVPSAGLQRFVHPLQQRRFLDRLDRRRHLVQRRSPLRQFEFL